jgi:hypothetical protein
MLAVLSDAVAVAIGVIAMESLCYSQLTPLKLVLALVSEVCYKKKNHGQRGDQFPFVWQDRRE